jgi:hypothetical protein
MTLGETAGGLVSGSYQPLNPHPGSNALSSTSQVGLQPADVIFGVLPRMIFGEAGQSLPFFNSHQDLCGSISAM